MELKVKNETKEIADAIWKEADRLKRNRKHLIIAIDGRCGAGKTTVAACLQERYGCKVIHMDHFFLRPEQRTKERLAEAGGNVDYERFREEVLKPLGTEKPFSYRPYSCVEQKLLEPVCVETGEITVIEGSYSCHPFLRAAYDVRVFLTVEAEEQMRRIERREGSSQAEIFRKRWIPMEENYFSLCQVREACDLIVQSGSLQKSLQNDRIKQKENRFYEYIH